MAEKLNAADSLSRQEETIEGSKTLYGNVWINEGKSLVQDIIVVLPTGQMLDNTVILVENIWEDLLTDGGKWKTNGKGYFYWIISHTDIGDDNLIHEVCLQCPEPNLIANPDLRDKIIKGNSDWAKYWKERIETVEKNYEHEFAIQRKSITLQGTEWIDQEGNVRKIETETHQLNNFGDIENLLSMF